jgi:hypothetical protein
VPERALTQVLALAVEVVRVVVRLPVLDLVVL